MSTKNTLTACLLAVALVACGGGSGANGGSGARSATGKPAATPSATSANAGATPPVAPAPAAASEDEVKASKVRFDDLGVSVLVPPGFHIVGDDELAARIRNSSNPRAAEWLKRSLKTRRSMPLLTVTRTGDSADDVGVNWVSANISVVQVPDDAKAEEIMAQQRELMQKSFDEFAVVEPSQNFLAEGTVDATRMEVKYRLKDKRVVSSMRVFVRNGLAFLASAMHGPDAPDGTSRAKIIVDGVHFYPPL